jgi:hypothetical protein
MIMYSGGTSEKIANSVKKKYDHRNAQVRSRLMLPYLTDRVGAALSITTVLVIRLHSRVC